MFEAEAELMVREEGKGWSSPTQVILRYGFFKIEEKNCSFTCSKSNILYFIVFRIMYDEDVFGARIIGRDVEAEDDQPDLCDHVIAMQNM
jgi:hypothetical protein